MLKKQVQLKKLSVDGVFDSNYRMIIKKPTCPLCGSKSGSVKKSVGGYPVWHCEECKAWIESVYVF